MHFRSLRSLATFTLPTLLLLGLASPAAGAAGDKDKDALKLHDDAIDNDYLNAEFPKAVTKLKDALKMCGTANCTPAVVAKLHVSLGTIYGAAMSKLPDAQAEFELALKADPAAALDASLSNPDLEKTFAAAKKNAGASGTAGAAGTGGAGGKKPTPDGGDAAVHTPPPEQTINTPVPVYLEPSEEVPLSKVTLRYKPFGSKTYKSTELKKIGKGFGGEIPCEDVTTTGDIKYFFALFDETGEAGGTLGSTKEPYRVTIKNEIEGEPPSLPGKKAPEVCKDVAPCPPDFPGCKEKDKTPPEKVPDQEVRGDRGWGASCEATQQCQKELACVSGTCQEGVGDDVGGGGEKKTKRNLVGIGLQLDWLLIGSRDNVCSPPGPDQPANYLCFKAGTSTQFDGVIAARTGTNGIQGGGAFADIRLLAGYERQLLAKIPLTVGVRIGWALGGSPTPDNGNLKQDADGNQYLPNTNLPLAKAFQGFHGEARAAYYLRGSIFEGTGKPLDRLRPYAFLAGGLAQANASVPVTVCDATSDGASKNNCKTAKAATPSAKAVPASSQASVDAYQVTGLGFVGFGAGTTFGITNNFGVAAELKFMFMVPTFGVVIAPTLGPVVAF